MIKKKIKNAEIEALSNASQFTFPKYTTQLINLVNSNAQGTRPVVVGQMSDLIQEFPGKTIQDWMEWYNNVQPNAIENATERIYQKFIEMKKSMELIDKCLIREWVEDLVYIKTFCGLKFQEAIIAYVAKETHQSYRLANKEEEAKGIDGFIGNKAVQIKSITYKMEARLGETIDVPIIFYEKKKDGITIEFDPSKFK
mgnify:CR=1 FL=1